MPVHNATQRCKRKAWKAETKLCEFNTSAGIHKLAPIKKTPIYKGNANTQYKTPDQATQTQYQIKRLIISKRKRTKTLISEFSNTQS